MLNIFGAIENYVRESAGKLAYHKLQGSDIDCIWLLLYVGLELYGEFKDLQLFFAFISDLFIYMYVCF